MSQAQCSQQLPALDLIVPVAYLVGRLAEDRSVEKVLRRVQYVADSLDASGSSGTKRT